MNSYDYIPITRPGGWILEVRKGPSCKGNIRKNRVTGRYQFYPGSKNVLHPLLAELDLETLKKRIGELDL